MAKINVVTPTNLGNSFRKDAASKKFEVNVDNSTIRVNEQGQLVAAGSSERTVWEGNVRGSTRLTITLPESCAGKTLHFFLMPAEADRLNDPSKYALVASIPIPAKAFDLEHDSRFGQPIYGVNTGVLILRVKKGDGTQFVLEGTSNYFCKLITMS